jgi:hypothetical protein
MYSYDEDHKSGSGTDYLKNRALTPILFLIGA